MRIFLLTIFYAYSLGGVCRALITLLSVRDYPRTVKRTRLDDMLAAAVRLALALWAAMLLWGPPTK